MQQTQACPDSADLCLFLELGGSDIPIALHVRGCAHCQSQLDELCRDSELEQWIRARSRNQTPIPTEGSMVDHYRLIRQIGTGGMSVVFEAIDTRLRRAVAIKLLKRHEARDAAVSRFMREASAIANIRHPNVVTIYHVETSEGGEVPYLVMELVDGPTMLKYLSDHRVIEPRLAASWIAQIAEGLEAAHVAGIVHRDIKPSNILLSPIATANGSGSDYVAKLADFGLAQTDTFDMQLTQSGILTGTPAYVSPEQLIDNKTSVQSDVYSLGVTLFQILTGELPFRGSPHAVLKQIAEEEIPNLRKLNPMVPLDLETICLKAANSTASHRYQKASELAADLHRWIRGESILARPTGPMEKGLRWVRRNRRVSALLATIVCLLILIASGTSWYTLAIAKSRRELAQQVITAQEAARTAQQATEQANEQRRIAEEQSQIAISQRSLAIDSINLLLDEVQQKLDFNAGALRLREKLLGTALAGLEKISNSAEDEAIVSSRISAYQQLASVQRLLGNSESARKSIASAVLIAEAEYERNKNSFDALTNLGVARAMQAENALSTFSPDAKGLFEESAKLLAEALEIRPGDFRCNRLRIFQRGKVGEIEFNAGRFAEARKWYEPALADLSELVRLNPDRHTLRREHCVMLRRQSQVLSALNEPGARDVMVQAVQLAEAGRKDDPDNPIHRSDLAYLMGALANLDCNEERFTEGIEHAKQSALEFEAIAALDPTNTQTRVHVSGTYDYLARIYIATGDLNGAIGAVTKSCDNSRALVERDPNTARFRLLLAESTMRLADILVRQRHFADGLEKSREAYAIMREAGQMSDAPRAAVDGALIYYQLMIDAVRIVAMGDEVSETQLHPLTILATKAYMAGLKGDSVVAWKYAREVHDALFGPNESRPTDLDPLQRNICFLNASRGAALSYRLLTVNANHDASAQSPEDFLKLAKDLLHESIRQDPSISHTLPMEPDLSFLKH